MLTFLTKVLTPITEKAAHSGEVLDPGAAVHAEQAADLNMSELIAHHLGDAPLWHLELYGYDISITKRVVMMWIASFLLFAVFIPAARKISKNIYKKPSRFTGFIELIVDFVRVDISRESMGKLSKPYDPFLLTMFVFILFVNLLGLVPPLGELTVFVQSLFGADVHAGGHGEIPLPVKLWPGITSTGDIAVTGTLAIFSFIVIIASGFMHQGILFIRNIVPKGIPLAIWPVMWPIELLGLITKPFALAIRLLANMTAGHIIILVFLSFIFQFKSAGVIAASITGSAAIYVLELFVGVLQAYIFVLLTSLFISGAQHRH